MSKYTTQLRWLIETNYDLGLQDYPIFDESYRKHLNKTIIDHFMFREIGFETAALFKHYLNATMNEIMPYYNVLYKQQGIMVEHEDIFRNLDFIEEFKRSKDSDSKSTAENIASSKSKASGKGTNLSNETPSGNISNLLKKDIKDQEYASNINLDSNTSDSDAESESTDTLKANTSDTENFKRHTYGNTGVRGMAYEMGELAKYLLNIDLMIINDLESLFMLIY